MRGAMFSVLIAIGLSLLAPLATAGQAGKSPVKVFLLAGQSNMQGQAVVDLDHERYYNGGKGNLEYVMRHSEHADMYKHLRDADGNWTVRDDVWVWYQTGKPGLKTGGLTIGFTGYGGVHHFGPELQFGHVVGDHFDNQVLLVKTAWGGKSIYKDLRPPSSDGPTGPFYTKMLAEFRQALSRLEQDFPAYDGGGVELAGFVWFQGWNDMCTKPAVPEYEENLANLIKDVRRELKAPNLPVVIGETGNCNHMAFRRAQAAVAERPEFEGTVAFVPTADFRRPAEESPNTGHGHHWFGNAESYFLIGQALGEAMVKLLEQTEHPN
jgi:hypothetical protein